MSDRTTPPYRADHVRAIEDGVETVQEVWG
jgi:hypothetical protein